MMLAFSLQVLSIAATLLIWSYQITIERANCELFQNVFIDDKYSKHKEMLGVFIYIINAIIPRRRCLEYPDCIPRKRGRSLKTVKKRTRYET